jgi:riboflavin transporter FmnP
MPRLGHIFFEVNKYILFQGGLHMNEGKSKQTLNALIIGLTMFILGLAAIITGFVLNTNTKNVEWYIYLLEIGGAALFLASSGNLYSYFAEKFHFRKMNVKQMGVIAVFAALSVILYYFAKFKLPFFPSWLDIQFSDVPAILVSFMYGPLSGAIAIIVRFFCKLPGTSTVGVGELADLLIGLAMVISAGLFYRKHRTLKGAFISIGIGMASGTIVAVISNWLILIPAYVNIAHFPWSALVDGMNKALGNSGVVTEENFMAYYLFAGVLPFNLFRYVLVFSITILLYKRLSMLIEHFTGDFVRDNDLEKDDLELLENNEVSSEENLKEETI